MAVTVFTGWRRVTPGPCWICGLDDGWQCDGRGTILCDCQACPDCWELDGHAPACPQLAEPADLDDDDAPEDPRLFAYRPHWTWETCRARYPRLVRAMQRAAILSNAEAACAIRDYRDGYGGPAFGGEAVHHYGGPAAVIAAAIRHRHLYRA